MSEESLKFIINNQEILREAQKRNREIVEKLSTSLVRQHQESIDKLISSALASEKITNAVKESCRVLSESIKMVSPSIQIAADMANAINERYKDLKFSIPKITIPRIEIPDELLESFRRYRYLYLYHQTNWPLFLIDNDELRQAMAPFIEIENPDPTQVKTAVLDYFDNVGIETIASLWSMSPGVEKDRLLVLQEAVDMYNQGFYYGCTSTLMCQIAGIISNSFQHLSVDDEDFDIHGVRLIYESYSGGSKLDKSREKKIMSGKVKGEEKQKLLFLLTEIDSGIMYWEAAADYLYNIVFTSSDDYYDHTCRNKICHGVQLNYGDKEHALKAILSVDLAIQLSNFAYRSQA